jgi:hypothetical protein
MLRKDELESCISSNRQEQLNQEIIILENKIQFFHNTNGSCSHMVSDPTLLGALAAYFRKFGFNVEIYFGGHELYVSWFPEVWRCAEHI